MKKKDNSAENAIYMYDNKDNENETMTKDIRSINEILTE